MGKCCHCGQDTGAPSVVVCPPCADTRARAGRMARRAAIKTTTVELVESLKVFERDGWTCQLCLDPVDKALLYPDPMSRSLDHVVPLAKGGAHTYANTQLAHLLCNQRKGARGAFASLAVG